MFLQVTTISLHFPSFSTCPAALLREKRAFLDLPYSTMPSFTAFLHVTMFHLLVGFAINLPQNARWMPLRWVALKRLATATSLLPRVDTMIVLLLIAERSIVSNSHYDASQEAPRSFLQPQRGTLLVCQSGWSWTDLLHIPANHTLSLPARTSSWRECGEMNDPLGLGIWLQDSNYCYSMFAAMDYPS